MLLDWQDNFENTPWLGLSHPFIAERNLYPSKQLMPPIAAQLLRLRIVPQEVVEGQ